MGPELWVGAAAVLVAGGAIGSAGTLLTQWILRKVDLAPGPGQIGTPQIGTPEYRAMRKQVAALGRQMRNVDARLDFTEQLLGGALKLAPPPDRLEPLDPALDIDPDPDQETEAPQADTDGT